MGEGLTQQQIDELLGNIQSGELDINNIDSGDNEKTVKDYDFRSPKRISREQVKFLENIFDNFARFFSMQLTSLMRVGCDLDIVDVEEQDYKEYNNALADSVLVGIFDIEADGLEAEMNQIIIEVARPLAFSMIDLLLGGNGSGYAYSREFTDIELKILKYLYKMMITHLNNAWSNYIELYHKYNMIETNSRVVQFLKPDDAMALITLKMSIKNVEGNVNVCVPAEFLEAVYPLFDMRANRGRNKDENKIELQRDRLFTSIKKSSLDVVGVLGETDIMLHDLLQLQKGDIIILNKKTADKSPKIVIEDEDWFGVSVGVRKKQYAVEIKKKLK